MKTPNFMMPLLFFAHGPSAIIFHAMQHKLHFGNPEGDAAAAAACRGVIEYSRGGITVIDRRCRASQLM
jgi:hypothetical protein